MNITARIIPWTLVATVALGVSAITASAQAKVIDLPSADRQILDKHLGKGVVGEAIDGERIDDPSRFYPLRDASLFYRVTSGKAKGKSEEHVWTELDRKPAGSGWRAEWGNSGLSMYRTDNGSIYAVSFDDGVEGVRYQYSPPQPIVLTGMRPGDERETSSDVNIFSLSKKNERMHSGSLDMTLSYVGAYRVKTPAGSYDAALLKWRYTGKIGSKKVDDVQYALLAPGVGMVAEVERQAVSGMLNPKDTSRTARTLLAAPQGSAAPAPKPESKPVASKPINSRDREAREVMQKFLDKDPGMDRFFRKAAGWAVFPSIAKGALIVGGARGDGVVYVNQQVIGYSTLTQGTIGLQIGGQAYSEIIFFEHDGALAHFKSGNAEFSGQVSAVAVTAGASADADYAEGVAVFTMAKGGAMLEASIGGQGFSYEPR